MKLVVVGVFLVGVLTKETKYIAYIFIIYKFSRNREWAKSVRA